MLDIEQKIMDEIGLPNNFRWYSGSNNCIYIRNNAIDNLESVIKRYVDNGEEISPCFDKCLSYIRKYEELEENEYTLTKTWIAIANVLRFLVEDYQKKNQKPAES